MRRDRPSTSVYYDFLESPVGTIFLLFEGLSLTGVDWRRPSGVVFRHSAASAGVKKELSEYFAGLRQSFSRRAEFHEGTAFEQRVWETLREIPYGETRTYKWLAERIGQSHAFRAVGKALGKNPLPIIFPCHRVVESGGSIGGYSAGVSIKRRLLAMEYYRRQVQKTGERQ